MAGMLFNVGEEHADYPALLLANYMLGGHSTSRLYNRIRAKEGLSYSVSSGLVADGTMPRAQWTTAAITNPVNIEQGGGGVPRRDRTSRSGTDSPPTK